MVIRKRCEEGEISIHVREGAKREETGHTSGDLDFEGT